MEWKDKVTYPSDKVYTDAEVLASTPDNIYRWMCFRIYGTEDPSPNMTPQYRSSVLEYWKKSISYFMNTTGKWIDGVGINVETGIAHPGTGNATQSRRVNNLINAVKRAETRGIRQQSVADRAFTMVEFRQILDLVSTQHRAMMVFQYHLIGRCDDTAHVKKSVMKASTQFPGYLTTKISWSKNVDNVHDCPNQIMLPSMDSPTCVYLNLVLWLEYWIRSGDGSLSQWLFQDGITTRESPVVDQDKEAIVGKKLYSTAVSKATKKAAFTRCELTGNLGSHSIRKLGATECRRRGVSKDDVDYRARWKMKRMQDRYVDIQLTWPDVNAASMLCQGGVCKYVVKSDAGLTDEWIASNVAHGITSIFGSAVGAILGKTLLWACFDSEWQEKVPVDIRHRTISNFICLQRNSDNEYNPIKRVQVIANEGTSLCSSSVEDDLLVDDSLVDDSLVDWIRSRLAYRRRSHLRAVQLLPVRHLTLRRSTRRRRSKRQKIR